jgi:hypothetical protein
MACATPDTRWPAVGAEFYRERICWQDLSACAVEQLLHQACESVGRGPGLGDGERGLQPTRAVLDRPGSRRRELYKREPELFGPALALRFAVTEASGRTVLRLELDTMDPSRGPRWCSLRSTLEEGSMNQDRCSPRTGWKGLWMAACGTWMCTSSKSFGLNMASAKRRFLISS